MDSFIRSANVKLSVSLTKLNSAIFDFYQLEPTLQSQARDPKLYIRDSIVEGDGEPVGYGSVLSVQPVDYDADSEADSIRTMTTRPSLHRRRSTFKKEKAHAM